MINKLIAYKSLDCVFKRFFTCGDFDISFMQSTLSIFIKEETNRNINSIHYGSLNLFGLKSA